MNNLCSILNLESIEQLIILMDEIPMGIIDYKLSKWGITSKDISIISKNSFTKIDKSIISLNEKEVSGILFSVL